MTHGNRPTYATRLFSGAHRAVVALCLLAAGMPGTTLTVATHYSNEQRRPLTACFEQYERLNPGIAIVHRQLSYRDFLQTLFMARISGTPPDIYNLETSWTAQLVNSRALAAPSSQVSNFVERSYLTETKEGMSSGGHVWGIPSEVNVYLLVYNKMLFARAHLARPPATWDELVDDAAKISKVNRQGQLTTAGFAFGPSPAQAVNPFLALLYSHGVPLFNLDHRSTNLTGAAAHEVLEGEARLFRTRGTSEGSNPTQFSSGSLGMMIVPNWNKKQLLEDLGDRFAGTVGVAPIRGGPTWRTVQYGFFWAVDSNSRHANEAWKLLQWFEHSALARTPLLRGRSTARTRRADGQ